MFKIVALLCAVGQDPTECQPPTAQDEIVLGEESSETSCMLQAQMSAGNVSILQKLNANEWIKFVCERKK